MLDNKNIQKIFSLGDIRKKQLLGEVPERTREVFREFGYFGGGREGGGTIVERIDYSNDTNSAITRGPLTSARYEITGSGNFNFGYFIGGWIGAEGFQSRVDRVNYSNDNQTASIRGNLTGVSALNAACGNSNFCHVTVGNRSNKIDYSNDLNTAEIRAVFSSPKFRLAATGNGNFGYFGGGSVTFPTPVSTIDRINYSNDSISTSIRGPLSSARFALAATGNSNFGYFGGGFPGPVATINRINYSNDTQTASVRGSLTISRYAFSANGNSNFGYFGGGLSPSLPSGHSTVNRIDYSNDTITSSTRGPLSVGKRQHAATSSHAFGGSPNSSYASNFTFPTVPNAGYFGGGSDGTNSLATIDKVDYANDTSTASVRSALSSARYALAATGNGSFGYFAGGRPSPGSPDTSTIDRIEYSSDTQNAVVRSTLNNAVRLLAAVGNSNFGYFGGGFPARNGVDRLDYSTDTTATSPRQGLPLATYSLAATGNRNFGYFCGGLTASPTTNRSEIYRVDYSNDLTIPQNRGPLSEAKSEGATTGNDSFGYFSGARNSGLSPSVRSQIERIDYSNDTAITSVRSRLNTILFATGATGNSNFGYFGGGKNGPVNFSVVDRINYSNDTAVASIRGPLSTGKSQLAATSPLAFGGAPIHFTNPLPEVLQKQIIFNDANTLDLPFKRVLGSYGYFGGGRSASAQFVSTVDRIDYSNDLSVASVRGPLSSVAYFQGFTSNHNFGFSLGGRGGTTSKIDFSNDTVLPKSISSIGLGWMICYFGNDNFGYGGGGTTSPAGTNYFSTIKRIDYSNDLATASTRGPLSIELQTSNGVGNNSFGYTGGGTTPGGNISTIQRVNYANDNIKSMIRGSLAQSKQQVSATGNSNFGYFGGGYNAPNVLSTVERINYANDLVSPSIRGTLTNGNSMFMLSATGNSNFGYFAGGVVGIYRSFIDRLSYTNDTQSSTVRGPLSLARRGHRGTTNARSS